MTPDDVKEAHALDKASFSLPWSERSYQFEVSRNPNSLPLVLEIGTEDKGWKMAGIMVIWLILDEAHIGTLAVAADYRRQGLARRLLAEGLLMSHARGARTAYLEVRKGNLPAQELYRQFGFTIEGIRPRYYKDNNEDALLLTLHTLDVGRLTQLCE